MDAKGLALRIRQNIEQCIVGKSRAIELILTALVCGGHILIEDVPGIGKTTLVSSLARSLDCSFKRIQFTPDILPSDVTGFTMPNLQSGSFEYVPGTIMSQIVLADEINRTSPKTQSALLEAMEEGQVTVDGVLRKLPSPFMVLATQNPIDFMGTYPLPEAQMDRFFMRLSMGYPSLAEEMEIFSRYEKGSAEIFPVATANDVIYMQEAAANVSCAEAVKEYIAILAAETRAHEHVQLGISTRGALALLRACKGWALIHGRDFVIPDDVQSLIMPVLLHRLILRPEARLKELTAERVMQNILKSVKVPKAS